MNTPNPNIPHSDSDTDELLTSYLDGELSEAERRQFQTRLMDEAPLRQRLHELQSAWDLLDEIPETPVDQAFTKSTLELVALRAEQEDASPSFAKLKSFGWFKGTPLAVILSLAGLICGVVAGGAARLSNKRNELRNLPVVTYLSGLKVVESPSVVQEIAALPDLELIAQRMGDASQSRMPPIPVDLKSRREWLDGLSIRQKSILWANEQEIQLSKNEFNSAKKLLTQVQAKPNIEKSELALSVVSALYGTLSSGDRDSLRQLSPEGKVHRIEQLLYRQLGEWYADNMDESDRAAILQWLQRRGDLSASFRFGPVMRDAVARRLYFATEIFKSTELDLRFKDEVEKLLGDLDESAKKIWDKIAENDKYRMLATWIDGAFQGGNPIDYEQLWNVYNRRQDSNDEAFDLMPYREVEARLRAQIRNDRRPKQNPNRRPGDGKPNPGK